MKPFRLARAARAALMAFALTGSAASAATVVDFSYTGTSQDFVVPAFVNTLVLETWGAQGFGTANTPGGPGGYSIGTLNVIVGDVLKIFVGGRGTAATGGVPSGGGFNGGGNAVGPGTGGGGGATDVRKNGSALGDRVIVAGGGGGATQIDLGGIGGDPILIAGPGVGDTATDPTQSGGGGGLFGGAPGSGGSSFIGGVTGGSSTPGLQQGDGAARISFTAQPPMTPVPVPASLPMIAAGIGLLAMMRRRAARQGR